MAKLNNKRKFPGGTSPRPDLSEIKRKEAAERQEYYDGLTIPQKLAKLDEKFGVGQGAKKQRARFAALLEKKSAPAPVAAEAPVVEGVEKPMKAKDRRRKEKGN